MVTLRYKCAQRRHSSPSLGLARGDSKAAVPWSKVSENTSRFFSPDVVVDGVLIRDPHNMSKDGVHAWLSHLARRQANDKSSTFRWTSIISGNQIVPAKYNMVNPPRSMKIPVTRSEAAGAKARSASRSQHSASPLTTPSSSIRGTPFPSTPLPQAPAAGSSARMATEAPESATAAAKGKGKERETLTQLRARNHGKKTSDDEYSDDEKEPYHWNSSGSDEEDPPSSPIRPKRRFATKKAASNQLSSIDEVSFIFMVIDIANTSGLYRNLKYRGRRPHPMSAERSHQNHRRLSRSKGRMIVAT